MAVNGSLRLATIAAIAGLTVAVCLSAASALTGTSPSDADRLWTFVEQRYAYIDVKQTNWSAAGRYYRAKYARASSARARFAVLEAMCDELYDAHAHPDANYANSWRLPAYDIWAEPRGGRFVVTGVRPGSRLDYLLGGEILRIDGVPVRAAIASRRPRFLRHPDPAADEWALLSALSGRHNLPRDLTMLVHGSVLEAWLPKDSASASPQAQAVTSRLAAKGVGYIAVTSFGDASVVAAFDRALEKFKTARALIVDLRDNSGGDTDVMLPIVGRFLTGRMQFAWMARRQGTGLGPRWPEYVDPRGPWTFRGRVVVLVDRWSESVAEGFAMGVQETRGAIVAGTPMAGLGAAVAKIHLPQNDTDVQISAEPVYSLDGRPRSDFRPALLVDLTRARGSDPILAAGLAATR